MLWRAMVMMQSKIEGRELSSLNDIAEILSEMCRRQEGCIVRFVGFKCPFQSQLGVDFCPVSIRGSTIAEPDKWANILRLLDSEEPIKVKAKVVRDNLSESQE